MTRHADSRPDPGANTMTEPSTSDTPLVSVIIPTHNRADLVPRAIHSVLNQTFTDLECIVVDDGSVDDTQQVVQSIDDDRLIYLRHEVNQNASSARNTGIAHAKGPLIAFLDDDDEWLTTKLEKQVPFIQSLPESVGLVYCWMDYYDQNDQLVKKYHPTRKGHIFQYALDGQPIGGCPTLLIRRSVIDKIGGFDESIRRGDDDDFIQVQTIRYVGGFQVDGIPGSASRIEVVFLDAQGNFIEDSITGPTFGGEIELRTVVYQEKPIIPAKGFIAIRAAVRFSPFGKHTLISAPAPTVGRT